MSMRGAIKLLVLSLLVFVVAFAVRRLFLWDVMPVSWEQKEQPAWALETAFFVLSIQNVAAAVAVIVVAAALALWIDRRRRAPPSKRG